MFELYEVYLFGIGLNVEILVAYKCWIMNVVKILLLGVKRRKDKVLSVGNFDKLIIITSSDLLTLTNFVI